MSKSLKLQVYIRVEYRLRRQISEHIYQGNYDQVSVQFFRQIWDKIRFNISQRVLNGGVSDWIQIRNQVFKEHE